MRNQRQIIFHSLLIILLGGFIKVGFVVKDLIWAQPNEIPRRYTDILQSKPMILYLLELGGTCFLSIGFCLLIVGAVYSHFVFRRRTELFFRILILSYSYCFPVGMAYYLYHKGLGIYNALSVYEGWTFYHPTPTFGVIFKLSVSFISLLLLFLLVIASWRGLRHDPVDQ